jgi:hypothetical protein
MDDKHDPNARVPTGTFQATHEDGELDIAIEIVADDDIEEQSLAIDVGPDDFEPIQVHRDLQEPPRRQRIATLLGVPLPGAAVQTAGRAASDASDPRKATSREITAAIENALENKGARPGDTDDERPTTIYGYKRNSLAELESFMDAEMTDAPRARGARPAASEPREHSAQGVHGERHVGHVEQAPRTTHEPSRDLVGVVSRTSETGTFELDVQEEPETRRSVPVLAPPQFVEARARDQREPRDAAKLEPQNRDLVISDRARERQPSKVDRTEVLGRKPGRVDSDPPPPKPISSLAPVELKRTSAKRKESNVGVGYALVAAMVLLGIGGWFLTAGGYRRGSDTDTQPTAAASQPTSPPTSPPSDALASAKLATMGTTPAPAPVEQKPELTAEPAPAPGPSTTATTTPARPRVASKSLRKPPAAPAPAPGDAEQPTRDDVLNGLDRVRSNVQACAEGRSGVAEVDLTIAANGIVTNALVGGDFGGTPQGSCIARAVRRARFPQFKQDRYRVLFPYVL